MRNAAVEDRALPLTLAEAALGYAENGWPVFPCKPGGKGPITAHGFLDATTDAATVAAWWLKDPDANIGLALPEGLAAVDVDGEEAMSSLGALGFDLPATANQRTPRGWHFIYSANGVPVRQTAGEIAPGVDIRVGGKSYLVVGPSRLSDSGEYYWETPLDWERIADAPEWLLSSPAADRLESRPMASEPSASVLDGVPEGRRDDAIFRYACSLRSRKLERNEVETLVLQAAANCKPPFPVKQALAKVKSAWKNQTSATSATSAGGDPQPLFRPLPPAKEFPVEALGSLAPAVLAIHEKVQAPLAICAQSILATATLAVQGDRDVLLPTGARPLANYFVTVAASGERKSTADREATRPVEDREKELSADKKEQQEAYEIEVAVWEKQRSLELGNKKIGMAGKKEALLALGPKPLPPLVPLLIFPEPSFEGLCRLFSEGYPSLGLFSSEGGQFLGGYGMTAEHRLRTAAGLSNLWDGQPIRRVRAGDGSSILPGRRLALHLMVQPGVSQNLLSDAGLADQGLLSRMLVAAPETLAGTRLWRKSSPESERALSDYRRDIKAILDRPLPFGDRQNELCPLAIPLDAEATKVWTRFADYVEKRLGVGGELEPISGFANKLAEHAGRLAAVVALAENLDKPEIAAADLKRGIKLAELYASEALRLFSSGQSDPQLVLADSVLKWLQNDWKHRPLISVQDLYTYGPNRVRNKAKAKSIVGVLEGHDWLVKLENGKEIGGRFRREVWELVEASI